MNKIFAFFMLKFINMKKQEKVTYYAKIGKKICHFFVILVLQ